MRTLFLIRHAKSSWDTPGLRDFDRPLNTRGMNEAPLMAKMLAEIGTKPDLLVSSPAKRAFSTALFFADAFQVKHEELELEPRIYEAYPQDILQIVSKLPDSADTVLLFGHNPTFTQVANFFAKDDFIENVPTCGIVKIQTTAGSWNEMHEDNAKVTAVYFPKEVL